MEGLGHRCGKRLAKDSTVKRDEVVMAEGMVGFRRRHGRMLANDRTVTHRLRGVEKETHTNLEKEDRIKPRPEG